MSVTLVTPENNPQVQYPVLMVDGRPFPSVFDADHIRNIPNFGIREDDVFICGYMRGGTHWMFEILNMLLQRNTDTVPDRKESLQLEHNSSIGKAEDYPSPRVLNTHILFEELPREVMDKKTKIVYLIRDPRDCLASWHKCMTTISAARKEKWNVPFQYWVEMSNAGKLEWGSWFQHLKRWEKTLKDNPNHPIHLVFYEDLIQNPVEEIVKLKDFLRLERDEDFCVQVADKTRFENMAKNKMEYTEIFGGETVHYNKGVVGNWRDVFTSAMTKDFNRRYEAEMKGSRFKDRYSCS